MSIILYNCLSDGRCTTKNIGAGKTLDCVFRKGTSVLTPIVEINSSNYSGENYCYITEFERYYFIGNVVDEIGGIAVIPCTVDALSTWWNYFKNNVQLIVRQENDDRAKHSLIQDNKRPLKPRGMKGGLQITLQGGENIFDVRTNLLFVVTTLNGSGVSTMPAEPEPPTGS